MDKQLDFDTFYRSYAPKILRLVTGIVLDEMLARDVVQDTFVIAWKEIDKFESRSSIYTWLYRIAINRALREKHHIGRQTEIAKQLARNIEIDSDRSDIWRETGIESPERKLAEDEISQEIQERCFWFYSFLLTEDQRIVFVLREILDLSYDQIAEVLEVSTDVVRSRLSRARSQFQRHLLKKCSWIDPANPCRCKDRIPYVLAKYPEILEKYRRRLTQTDIDRRLNGLEISAKDKLSLILRWASDSRIKG